MGWLAATTTVLILFTLVVLERVEARLGRGEAANDLKLYLKDDHRAVGLALTAIDRLGIPVKLATVLPAAGETAVLRVELSRPLKADQTQRIVQKLLTVNAITRVDIAALEVEDVEALAEESNALREGIHAQLEELKLNDDNLLRDLIESKVDGSAASDANKNERR